MYYTDSTAIIKPNLVSYFVARVRFIQTSSEMRKLSVLRNVVRVFFPAEKLCSTPTYVHRRRGGFFLPPVDYFRPARRFYYCYPISRRSG